LTVPAALACSDLDLDGDADLAVATRNDHTVAWIEQDSGRATNQQRYKERRVLTSRLNGAADVIAADLTGDGKAEVVAGGHDGQILLWENLGAGRFSAEILLDETLAGLDVLDVADVDSDGKPDILAATLEKIVWYRNRGGARFEAAQLIDSLDAATWLRPLSKTIAVVNASDQRIEHRLAGLTDVAVQPAVSPDGSHLAVGDAHSTIRIWELPSERLIRTLATGGPQFMDLIYSPDGQYLLAAVGDVLWILNAGDYRLLHKLQDHDSTLRRITVSADSQQIASVSDDMSVRLWSLPDGRHERALLGHKAYPTAVAYSPDGRCLATGDGAGRVHIWDLVAGQELLVLHEAEVMNPPFTTTVFDLCFRDARTLLAILRDDGGNCWLAEWRTE
jgi:WD40 repeat protein